MFKITIFVVILAALYFTNGFIVRHSGPSHLARLWCAQDSSDMGDKSIDPRKDVITPTPGVSSLDKFLMIYTCLICSGRNAQMVSKVAYNEGMVVSTCKHCSNRHLIADNERKLDMGPDAPEYRKVEEVLKARGEMVNKLQLTADDLLEGRYFVDKGDVIDMGGQVNDEIRGIRQTDGSVQLFKDMVDMEGEGLAKIDDTPKIPYTKKNNGKEEKEE